MLCIRRSSVEGEIDKWYGAQKGVVKNGKAIYTLKGGTIKFSMPKGESLKAMFNGSPDECLIPPPLVALTSGCCLAVIHVLKHGVLTVTNQSQDSYAPQRSFIHCSIIRDNPRFVIIQKAPDADNGSLLLLTECLYKMTKRDTEQASQWTAARGMILLKNAGLRKQNKISNNLNNSPPWVL